MGVGFEWLSGGWWMVGGGWRVVDGGGGRGWLGGFQWLDRKM